MKLKIIGMFYIQFYQCVTQTPSDQEILTSILFRLQNQHDLGEHLFLTVFLGATDIFQHQIIATNSSVWLHLYCYICLLIFGMYFSNAF